MQIFWEKCEEIKRELFILGQVPVLVHSPKVWEHPLGSHPQVPLPQENALLRETHLQHITYSILKQSKSK